MKKGISVILAVLLAVSCLTGLSGCGSSKKKTQVRIKNVCALNDETLAIA